MRVFITGAASPLGRAVTSTLVRRGHRVVGLARRRSGLKQVADLGADPIAGDVRRRGGWAQALAECDTVFHLASYFDFWSKEPDLFDAVNVDGTRHTLLAAAAAKVRRVVLCSSALTVADPGSDAVSGTVLRSRPHTKFERSQRTAERLALQLRARGIEVVVVHPSLVVAPSDPGWTGRLIAARVRGRQQLAAHATVGWIWVNDAAEGIVRAAERGDDGARYVLSGELMSSHAFLTRVAARAGTAPPRTLPRSLVVGEGALASAIAHPFRRRPKLTLEEARFLAAGFRVDGRAAAAELELSYTSVNRYLPGLVRSYQQAVARFAN
jgi:nucleoside-diphosphate-sugar epimerase